MKVSFNKAALQEALGLVTSIIPSRTPKPILQCLQISAEKDTVKLCATDLEVGISYHITQVQVETPGQAVIPADKFTAIVRESNDEVIELETKEATSYIKGSDSHFTIYGHDPGQYPAVPDAGDTADIEIALNKLQEGIELCLFAVARESSRFALNGVLWETQGKKLILVGTDGRRLAYNKVNLISVSSDKAKAQRTIVPTKTMALLSRITGSQEDKVTVKFVDNQAIFGCGNCIISSNLIEGSFPKYEDIIPTDYDKKITLSTQAALSAVRRAALLTNEDSKGIKLAISNGSLVLTCRAPEAGDSEVDMAISYDGPPIEVGFNPQFLIDVLRVIRAENFELELGQPDRPGMIKSGSFLYVVMPINLG